MKRDGLISLDRSLLFALPGQEDVVVVRARGTKVWDVSGRRYTDLFSGIAVDNVGHAHPAVTKAIAAQAGRYMHVSNLYHNDVEPALAQKLTELAPGSLARVFFANSGAEAVEGAVKFAKKHAVAHRRGGEMVAAFEGSFHGRLGLSLTLTGQAKYKHGLEKFAEYPGIVHLPVPYYYRYGEKATPLEFGFMVAEEIAEDLDRRFPPGEPVAVIIEPIFGEGGIIVPPDNFLPLLQRVCRERGILFITDEVQTGIGRTGRMFASEHWGLKPDIMTLAKGLGGGLPLAAILATNKVASAMSPGDHFSTFGGNPVCCAAGIATLDVIRKEKLIENSAARGAQLVKLLGESKAKLSQIGDVRGKGLMVGIELILDSKKTPAQKEALLVKAEMLKAGYLVGVGGIHRNVVRIQPPLVITAKEIEAAAHALAKAITHSF